ncbi:hypothetical protein DL89DRAFT_74513 [Linderina pennispora]|uniref:Uncharacterized protein n=1 Tax=Linderina pennispora TaxID=61395 RepID=A0A1Y1VQN5_9FUNG|nr:uncharacterized protein DL89DRAFT_74513 [Linderina pennispora]ORX63599.1 hypothetical protein DL89DRAFT_74513 [Linderina pennispora]
MLHCICCMYAGLPKKDILKKLHLSHLHPHSRYLYALRTLEGLYTSFLLSLLLPPLPPFPPSQCIFPLLTALICTNNTQPCTPLVPLTLFTSRLCALDAMLVLCLLTCSTDTYPRANTSPSLGQRRGISSVPGLFRPLPIRSICQCHSVDPLCACTAGPKIDSTTS